MTSSRHSAELLLRRRLLGTASAVAALTAFHGQAVAGDASPSDWHATIDLGGQYTFYDGGKTIYADPFAIPPPKVGIANGVDGWLGLGIQNGDGWIFGVNFNYGRTGNSHGHFAYSVPQYYSKFYSGSGAVKHTEAHTMLDFTVGRDVGLGLFNLEGSSVVSAGIRWAHFSAKTVGNFSYSSKYFNTAFNRTVHRAFNGVGPVISWNAATPIATEFTLDWGASGAVLFGPRKVWEEGPRGFADRRRDATVPQLGGYLGVGWHRDGCPLTVHFGYAVQASWGVLDGNFNDATDHNSVDRIWHGPYLDLSIPIR